MREVDCERFWRDNDIAILDPFGKHIPQAPMGMGMGYHSMFAELGLPEDLQRFEQDYDFARSAARRYNDLSEKIVGRRLLNETAYDPTRRFPAIKGVGELFGCEKKWEANSWWLMEAAHTPAELEKVLDRVEKLDLRAAMFPDNWESECRRIYQQHGLKPFLNMSLRGPVTLATSIYGTENFLYLLVDEPQLAQRFRDVMLQTILQYYRICRQASDPARVEPGFSFADDNCALLTPEMYAFFGQPILKAVFAEFAPGPDDPRYQHSDSDMGHLLPLLAETGLKRVNFGPNIRFSQIRAAMPHAVVEGTMAPFTFMRNDEDQIIFEVRRDLDEARQTRGLLVATAGSVNDGTRLTSLRAVMQTIQQYGQYPNS